MKQPTIATAGYVVFAATMIAIGITGLIRGDFAAVWQPGWRVVVAQQVLAYLCAIVSLGCGIGLLWKRTAAVASRLLLLYLVAWLVLFKASRIIVAPASQDTWSGCAETAAIVAGAWVLYAWTANRPAHLRFARVSYGLALIPFGLAHFNFPKETATLVPSWLPAHMAWAYFTGAAFLAAAAAVLFGAYARLAATLSAWQLGLFTLLVWVPMVAAGANAFQWSEFVISCAVTAGAWLVAESYRGVPWLAAGNR